VKVGWFFYYSTRCRRHRELACTARTDFARDAHRRLACQYADRAARAMAQF